MPVAGIHHLGLLPPILVSTSACAREDLVVVGLVVCACPFAELDAARYASRLVFGVFGAGLFVYDSFRFWHAALMRVVLDKFYCLFRYVFLNYISGVRGLVALGGSIRGNPLSAYLQKERIKEK